MDYIEYQALDGTAWRVEKGSELLGLFELVVDEADPRSALLAWHEALSTQGVTWEILCRLYAINPAFGEDDVEKFQPWSMERVAEAFGLRVREIAGHVDEARTYWERWSKQYRDKLRQEDAARARVVAPEPERSDTEKAELLRRYGFGGIENADERAYILSRVDDLGAALEDGQSRTVALSMLQQEVNIFFGLDPMVAKLRREIGEVGGGSAKSLEERLTRLTKARADAQAALENSREALGMNESQTGAARLKASAQATLSSYIEGLRAWHARGEMELIDGIFTAQEVELLTTEYSIRPAQYRPDLVATLNECLRVRSLFDPAYTPPAFARKGVQRLRRGFTLGLAEARNENGEVVTELDEESREEAIDQATREGERGIGTLGLEAVGANAAVAKPVARSESRRGRADELADY